MHFRFLMKFTVILGLSSILKGNHSLFLTSDCISNHSSFRLHYLKGVLAVSRYYLKKDATAKKSLEFRPKGYFPELCCLELAGLPVVSCTQVICYVLGSVSAALSLSLEHCKLTISQGDYIWILFRERVVCAAV